VRCHVHWKSLTRGCADHFNRKSSIINTRPKIRHIITYVRDIDYVSWICDQEMKRLSSRDCDLENDCSHLAQVNMCDIPICIRPPSIISAPCCPVAYSRTKMKHYAKYKSTFSSKVILRTHTFYRTHTALPGPLIKLVGRKL